MRIPLILLCGALACVFAQVLISPKSAQAQSTSTASEEQVANTGSVIETGTQLDVALATLDGVGATKEGVWQRGAPKGIDVKWRDISEGITLEIRFQRATKKITALQMMYIPPTYASRGNYRIVAADRIVFHSDGTYAVTFPKPKTEAERKSEKAEALKNRPQPKFPPSGLNSFQQMRDDNR